MREMPIERRDIDPEDPLDCFDYVSVELCKAAIDRHFWERNAHFLESPKRAGNKIWEKERIEPVFDETKNSKYHNYQ